MNIVRFDTIILSTTKFKDIHMLPSWPNIDLLIFKTSIYSLSPSTINCSLWYPQSSLFPSVLTDPPSPHCSPQPSLIPSTLPLLLLFPSLQLRPSLCSNSQWPGSWVWSLGWGISQGYPSRDPPYWLPRGSPHRKPRSGFGEFPCLDIVHENFHPVELGSEGAEVLLQSVELLVQVTQCVRQWLDSGKRAQTQQSFKVQMVVSLLVEHMSEF